MKAAELYLKFPRCHLAKLRDFVDALLKYSVSDGETELSIKAVANPRQFIHEFQFNSIAELITSFFEEGFFFLF